MTKQIGRVAVGAAIACLLWPLLKCAMPRMALDLSVAIGEVLATFVGSLALCRWLSQSWLARQSWRDSSARHAACSGAFPAGLAPQGDVCVPVSSSEIKTLLPKKSVGKQLLDGFDSYFDGLGWALTMWAAKNGWLENANIEAQAAQISHSLSNIGSVALDHPAAVGSAAWAAAQTYPWQIAARGGTNMAVANALNVGSGGTVSTKSSYVLAGAAVYGTLAHDAFAHGGALTSDDAAMAAVSGIICPGKK